MKYNVSRSYIPFESSEVEIDLYEEAIKLSQFLGQMDIQYTIVLKIMEHRRVMCLKRLLQNAMLIK